MQAPVVVDLSSGLHVDPCEPRTEAMGSGWQLLKIDMLKLQCSVDDFGEISGMHLESSRCMMLKMCLLLEAWTKGRLHVLCHPNRFRRDRVMTFNQTGVLRQK